MAKAREAVEMNEEYRARLLALAALRGERLSDVVAEAIELYLSNEGDAAQEPARETKPRGMPALMISEEARRAAFGVRGSLTEGEAKKLATETAALRRSWRASR